MKNILIAKLIIYNKKNKLKYYKHLILKNFYLKKYKLIKNLILNN